MRLIELKENQNIEFKETWKDEWLQWICGFANQDGGTLYIGVKDNGEIKGIHNAHKLAETLPQTVKHLLGIIVEINILNQDDLEYLEIIIEKYLFPISYHGRCYLRSGKTNLEVTGIELEKFMLKKLGVTWDSIPYKKFDIDDLDKDLIKIFREESIKSKRLTEKDLDVDDKILLEKLDLYENGYLTNAAVLLFHKTQERNFTGSSIKIGYFEKNHADLRYQDEIVGPLITQVDRTIEMIYSKYLKGFIWYDDIYRREEYMFPREAFREILLNAVNNKTYSSGVPIQVSVYEDEIYVFNMGTFPKTINIEKIYEKHSSKPYNPRLALTFFKAGMIESWGRGFEKIKEECEKGNIPLPIVEDQGGEGVMIHILPSKKYMELLNRDTGNKQNGEKDTVKKLSNGGVNGGLSGGVNGELNKNEQKIINSFVSDFVNEDGGLNSKQINEITNISMRTIERSIKSLKEKELIQRIGSDKTGYWKLK